MGLDMYAYTVNAKDIGDQQVDIDVYNNEGEPLYPSFFRQFAYWRKFNHLHGWMEQLYRKKNGVDPQFNCVIVRLMPEDIDLLESMASLKALPATPGFFFGAYDSFNDEDKEEVLAFVHKAREAFKEGKAVLYDSWW